MATHVKITNRSRTAKTYNLTVQTAPRRMKIARRTADRDGNVVTQDRRLMVPDSITLLAGESKVVPKGWLTSPELRGAVDRRDLACEDAADPTPAPVEAPAPVEVEAAPVEVEAAPADAEDAPRARRRG